MLSIATEKKTVTGRNKHILHGTTKTELPKKKRSKWKRSNRTVCNGNKPNKMYYIVAARNIELFLHRIRISPK